MSKKQVRIKIKNKGSLSELGYSSKNPKNERVKSLNKAITKYGSGDVVKKLNAVATLTKNTNPKASSTFKADVKYVQGKTRGGGFFDRLANAFILP